MSAESIFNLFNGCNVKKIVFGVSGQSMGFGCFGGLFGGWYVEHAFQMRLFGKYASI
jgi:hypothetical protein